MSFAHASPPWMKENENLLTRKCGNLSIKAKTGITQECTLCVVLQNQKVPYLFLHIPSKLLFLFEWSENPGEKQWTGSSLTQRIVNIVTVLLRTLEQNKGIRSFWHKDSCLTRFLHSALRDIFDDKITKVLEKSVGTTKKPEESPPIPKGPYWMNLMNYDWDEIIDTDFMSASSVFCSIYIQALLEKLAPVEDFYILSSYFKSKDDSISVSGTDSFSKEEGEEIVKNARDVFEKNARKTMNDLDSLPDYSLWSQEFEHDRVASLLKLLSENFNKDLEIMHNRIRALKESRKTGNSV